jgi:hypothetical protein
MTMNTRQSWVLGAAIVLGCLILGLFFGQPSVAQKKDNPVTPGRFQILNLDKTVAVIDTGTGKTWSYSGNQRWDDMGSPVEQKKK